MRNPLLKALPWAAANAWLGARFHQLPVPPIIRRHPWHSAGVASAAIVGVALLVSVLQAHSPEPDGMEASAQIEETSAAEASLAGETLVDEMPTEVAAPLANRTRMVAPAEAAQTAPDAERWATDTQAAVRRVDDVVAQTDSQSLEAQAAAFELEPDRTLTAAIDPGADLDGLPDGGEVAIAESEIEVAALETRMADEDSAVFAAPAVMEGGSTQASQGVVTSYVNFRAAPDNEAEILRVLPQNATVTVLDDCPNWCEIEHDGVRGYVYGSFLDRGAAAALDLTEVSD